MLTAERKRLLSRDFSLLEDGETIADVAFSSWRDRATLDVRGTSYEARRERWLSGVYVLEHDGIEVARAEPQGFWRRSYEIRYGHSTVTLRRKGWTGRAFAVFDGDSEVGSVTRAGFFRTRAVADLPAGLDAAVRAFIVWLAVVRWQHDQAAASGG